MDKLIKRTRRSAMDLIKVPKESLPICGDCGGIMLIRKKKKKGTKNSKKSAYYCPCCDNKY
ncbi:hypothetical protein CSB07_00280 [Candidatus Gracilibacteria bacterium]|nr:MAG: hypothetical protein CSB07_00280 [Candidatus Gracilibacteria bacterium]PIE85816.1 MAG: hypothetical protein CSA08_00015 [Candidatus Gracilibacteria bacterium]